MGKITFLVTKDETTYDMSELVESVTWSGRKGSPARSLSVSLIDDDGWKHARSGIDVTKGNHCVFYWEGEELFSRHYHVAEAERKKDHDHQSLRCWYLSVEQQRQL